MIAAFTMTNTNEAIGIVQAAAAATIPVVISFTVETDGSYPVRVLRAVVLPVPSRYGLFDACSTATSPTASVCTTSQPFLPFDADAILKKTSFDLACFYRTNNAIILTRYISYTYAAWVNPGVICSIFCPCI